MKNLSALLLNLSPLLFGYGFAAQAASSCDFTVGDQMLAVLVQHIGKEAATDATKYLGELKGPTQKTCDHADMREAEEKAKTKDDSSDKKSDDQKNADADEDDAKSQMAYYNAAAIALDRLGESQGSTTWKADGGNFSNINTWIMPMPVSCPSDKHIAASYVDRSCDDVTISKTTVMAKDKDGSKCYIQALCVINQ